MGQTISKSCKGLPLAIVVIARLLKLSCTQDYWEKFVRNMHEAMAEVTRDDQLMKILSLSYDNLPRHLKACFLYTSMFPEDSDIPTIKLKWLWLAEGFLKPTADKSLEEVAEKCLLDLVDRNLFSVSKRSSSGRIRNCTVHDLLRDLSLRKSQEDKFSMQIMTINTSKTTSFTRTFFQKCISWFKAETNSDSEVIETKVIVYRRCSDISNLASNSKYGYIYSLICHGKKNYKDMLLTSTSNLVRVLDVLKTPFELSLPFGVNLRYLAFCYSDVYDDLNATLAEVRKLQNLETLNINHNVSKTLFFPILEMPKLKHFIVQARWSEYCLNDYRSNSNSNKSLLKTLSGVCDFKFAKDDIEILTNLVKLKITYGRYIIDRTYLKNLVCLHQLENLNLRLKYDRLQLPNNISFPGKLKKITLRGFMISWETMSVMGSLPNLQVLKLVNCKFESAEWEPVELENFNNSSTCNWE